MSLKCNKCGGKIANDDSFHFKGKYCIECGYVVKEMFHPLKPKCEECLCFNCVNACSPCGECYGESRAELVEKCDMHTTVCRQTGD